MLSYNLISQFTNSIRFVITENTLISSRLMNISLLLKTLLFSDFNIVFIKDDKNLFNVNLFTLIVVNT